MSKVKNQHTVPQSYLRFFADSNERVFGLNKKDSVSFHTNVKNVACERFFYDFPNGMEPFENGIEDVPDQFVEKFLSEIDGKYPTQIKKVLAALTLGSPEDLVLFQDDDRLFMSYLMVVQIFRTTNFRDFIHQMHDLIGETLLKDLVQAELPDLSIGEFQIRIKPESLPIHQAEYIVDIDMIKTLVEIFHGHIWTIWVNQTKLPFYTSDNPVVKTNGTGNPDGYQSYGIEIYYPLSPSIILALCDREHFADMGFLDGTVLNITDEENVKYVNYLQIKQSDRHVFCKTDDFDFAKQVISERPNVKKKKQLAAFYKGKKVTLG